MQVIEERAEGLALEPWEPGEGRPHRLDARLQRPVQPRGDDQAAPRAGRSWRRLLERARHRLGAGRLCQPRFAVLHDVPSDVPGDVIEVGVVFDLVWLSVFG